MRIKNFGALLLLAVLWEGSFLFLRVTAPAFGPLLQAAPRDGIAGAALLVSAAVTRTLPNLRVRAKGYLIIGALTAVTPDAESGMPNRISRHCSASP